MYELHRLGEHTYYIAAPTNMGLYVRQGKAWLIDSGQSRADGVQALACIRAQGWTLEAVFNTHGHADHIGGNRYLEQATGCKCYCPMPGMARMTELEPTMIYQGKAPRPLEVPFFHAEASAALPLEGAPLPEGLQAFPLEGHLFAMAGFRAHDGTVFLADSIAGAGWLEKFHIFYLYHVPAFLRTLEALRTCPGRIFLPSHTGPVEDLPALAQKNWDKVQEILAFVRSQCTMRTFDEIVQAVFTHYHLHLNLTQYALIGGVLKSYLSYLIALGQVRTCAKDGFLLWTAEEGSP